MLAFLGAGAALGLYAGFSPGPLLALVISQTIKHGPKEGVKVAFAPLITDLPIIFVSTLLLIHLSGSKSVIGLISIFGGAFLGYLAYGSITAKVMELNTAGEGKPYSFVKGAIVNALSPHPYMFWITIGAPILTRGLAMNTLFPVLFVGSFLGCIVGAKVLIAIIAGKSRDYLTGRVYVHIMRVLGALLLILAFVLIQDGLRLLQYPVLH